MTDYGVSVSVGVHFGQSVSLITVHFYISFHAIRHR